MDERTTPAPLKAVRRGSNGRRQLENPNPEARRRLLDAAQALVEEHGEPGVRVEEVARKAGLSVGTFYLYFEGKSDLLVQLVQVRTEVLRDRMLAAGSGSAAPSVRLDRALAAYFDFVEEAPQAFRHFLAAGSSLQTTEGPLANWAVDQHAADIRPILEAAMAAGEIRRYDTVLLSQTLTGLAQHLAGFWVENLDDYDRDDILAHIRHFNTAALRP